jgi:hypothetical protein
VSGVFFLAGHETRDVFDENGLDVPASCQNYETLRQEQEHPQKEVSELPLWANAEAQQIELFPACK